MGSAEDDVRFEPGTVIDDKFQVRRVLGEGAMGAVIEAVHLLRRAPVALKFMSPHMISLPGVVERFLNEGVAASRINSEHVVKVLDVSKLPNGQPYLVMEFLEGEDLANLLEREGLEGLADVGRAIHFVLQILRGLQMAHQVGIVHRDLKPANCFVVEKDGYPDFIKLVDFGISKVQDPDDTMQLTQEGSTMGTPLYVSPEQARDATKADPRSDIYSVSVMLYELLSGRLPIEPASIADLYMKLAVYVPRPLDELRPGLPPGLSDLVQKGLSKLPEERFQSALEMAHALAPYADERSDIVLRQITHRSSVRASRPPSVAPPRASIPPPSSVAFFETIPTELRAPSIAATPGQPAVAATLEPVSAGPQRPSHSGRSLLIPGGIVFGLAVLGVGASVVLGGAADKDAPVEPTAAPLAAADRAPAAEVSAPSLAAAPSADHTAAEPPSDAPHSQAHSRSASGGASSPDASARGRPAATPASKPSLKTIAIQD